MSAGKHYGDPCDNEGCDHQDNGKCQKYAEFYDPNLSKEEKIRMIGPMIMELMLLHDSITSELKSLHQIGRSLLDSEDINDILSDIENKVNKEG